MTTTRERKDQKSTYPHRETDIDRISLVTTETNADDLDSLETPAISSNTGLTTVVNHSPLLPCLQAAANRASLEDLASTNQDVIGAYKDYQEIQSKQLLLLEEKLELEQLITTQNIDPTSDNWSSTKYGVVNQGDKYRELTTGPYEGNTFNDVILRLNTVEAELNRTNPRLEQFATDFILGGPITMGPNGTKPAALTAVLGRMDLALLLAGDTELRNPEELDKVFQSLVNVDNQHKKEEKLAAISAAKNLLTSYLETLPDVLKSDGILGNEDHFETIRESFSSYNLEEALVRTEELTKDLRTTNSYQKNLHDLESLLNVFEKLPTYALEQIGIEIPRTSKIFSLDFETIHSQVKLTDAEILQLPPEQREIAKDLRSFFWPTNTTWDSPIKEEYDLQALITSYASLNRISELVSAFDSRLSEIENSNSNPNEKVNLRQDAVIKFWSLYDGTTELIQEKMTSNIVSKLRTENGANFQGKVDELFIESLKLSKSNHPDSELGTLIHQGLIKAISNHQINISNSTFQESRDIIASPDTNNYQNGSIALNQMVKFIEPYYGLIAAFNIISPENHLNKYSESSLSSIEDTRKITFDSINPAFNEISNYLVKTRATPAEMQGILQHIRHSNSAHPEIDKIDAYVKSFETRFRRLYPTDK